MVCPSYPMMNKPNRSSMTFGMTMRNGCSNASWKSAILMRNEKRCFVSCS